MSWRWRGKREPVKGENFSERWIALSMRSPCLFRCNCRLGPIGSFHRRKFLSFRTRDYSVKSCAFVRIDRVRSSWEIVRSASRNSTDRAGRRKGANSTSSQRALDQSTISTVSSDIPRIRFHVASVEACGLTMTNERIQPRINLISECLLKCEFLNDRMKHTFFFPSLDRLIRLK